MLDSSFQSKKEKFDIERYFSNKILSFEDQDDAFNQSVAGQEQLMGVFKTKKMLLNFSQN